MLFTKTWSSAKATQNTVAAAAAAAKMTMTTTKTRTIATTRVTDDCDVLSNFRIISIYSFVFQMKRLVERTAWPSLSAPLNSLS